MKAKDFLNRAREAEADLRRLEALMEHYRTVGTSITSKWDATPRSGRSAGSRVESAVLGIVEAEEGVYAELEAYRKTVLEAEKMISRIRQGTFRQLLTLHYLAGLSLAETGERLGYRDRNSVYRAHGYALQEAQKILDIGGIGDDRQS